MPFDAEAGLYAAGMSADSVITRLNIKAVDNPDGVDLSAWEPVFFE